jgi:hypothetical protein
MIISTNGNGVGIRSLLRAGWVAIAMGNRDWGRGRFWEAGMEVVKPVPPRPALFPCLLSFILCICPIWIFNWVLNKLCNYTRMSLFNFFSFAKLWLSNRTSSIVHYKHCSLLLMLLIISRKSILSNLIYNPT